MSQKPITIIVGKSGSGKNYIPEALGLTLTPGYTTRELRPTDNSCLKRMESLNIDEVKDFICGETFFNDNWYFTYIEDFNNYKYDFVILSKEGLQNILIKKEFQKEFFKKNEKNFREFLIRDYNIIYIECTLIKRFLNMYKRGDSLKNIIKRLIHDRKAFKGIKQIVLNNDGKIIKL